MSKLTFDDVASDIQCTAKIPFDIDEFISIHNVRLSSKVKDVWSRPPPDMALQDVVTKLKQDAEGMQSGTRQLVREFLKRVDALPSLSSQTEQLLKQVEQARSQTQEAIESIQQCGLL